MPSFCRHNRLVQNCPICSREQAVEMRPVISSGPTVSPARRTAGGRPAGAGGSGAQRAGAGTRGRGGGTRQGSGLRVRRLARGVEDGYSCRLVPGLRSSQDAARLADELGRSAMRLEALAGPVADPYVRVADPAAEAEERTWLACQIAFLGLPRDGEVPFGPLEGLATSWSSGDDPAPAEEDLGPRAVGDPARSFPAYRAWAARAGGQVAAFTGELAWSPPRRFARVYERLALPGVDRDPRFELLVVLGATGVYELSPASLHLGGPDGVTVAAKRVFGIGDPLLLDRRAADLAEASGVPLAALDRALYDWGRGESSPDGGRPEDAEELAAAVGEVLEL